MNFEERLFAVFYHEEPDLIPFSHFWLPLNMPTGEFEHEMRNRGMGLWTWTSSLWFEMPNVSTETRMQGNILITTYHTPLGSVTTKSKIHQKRTLTHESLFFEWMIKDEEDYDPVIYMIEDTVFHMDETPYLQMVRDFGGDGVVLDSAWGSAYGTAKEYFGLVGFFREQIKHPDEFKNLLRAIEKRNDRAMSLIIDSPAKIITLGGIDGDYGPRQFKRYDLPFYKKYIPRLHAKGKICHVHAHSLNLRCIKDLIPKTGLDIIHSFTLPPVGDLSIEEARIAWGDEIVIWAGFPDTMLCYNVEEIKEYTIDTIRNAAPYGSFILGMEELGLNGIIDDRTEHFVKKGLRTVIKTVNRYSKYYYKYLP